MRFYNSTFFCDKGSSLKANVLENSSEDWPITLQINNSGKRIDNPDIIFFCNRNQLFMLADSINTAINKLLNTDPEPDMEVELDQRESLLEQKYDDKYHALKDEGEI